jgi:hypothetical protein
LSAFRRLRQEDFKFKPTWAILQDPVSKKQNDIHVKELKTYKLERKPGDSGSCL